MTRQPQSLPADHPPVRSGGIGVLLVNLGTPDAPDAKSVRRYLAEFLSDRRVVEIPPLVWQPILRGAILTTRPRKSAHAYAQVWTEAGSPLAAITAQQTLRLQERLGADVTVAHAMRYGRPEIGTAIQTLMDQGCDRILLAPLYPQYSAATTATVVDKAAEKLRTMRWQPALRTMPPYHDDPHYIDALAGDLGEQIDALEFVPEVLLLSFHGMPQRTLELGDPYHCHARKTARLVNQALDRPHLRMITTFQSRFGRAKWLEPATDEVLAAEARRGTRRLAIAAPGFSADCLETLEELPHHFSSVNLDGPRTDREGNCDFLVGRTIHQATQDLALARTKRFDYAPSTHRVALPDGQYLACPTKPFDRMLEHLRVERPAEVVECTRKHGRDYTFGPDIARVDSDRHMSFATRDYLDCS